MNETEKMNTGNSKAPGNWISVMLPPVIVLMVSIGADFGFAKVVGVPLGFDALIQLMMYGCVQSGLGYWVGWKMFRSGPALAQWHVFGVTISGALAAALYLCAQLFVGGRNMPSSESGWAMLFNIFVGLAISFYLALRLRKD